MKQVNIIEQAKRGLFWIVGGQFSEVSSWPPLRQGCLNKPVKIMELLWAPSKYLEKKTKVNCY